MDNRRRSFLTAICAEPDDEAPRLVFSDFLEEFGDAQDLAWAEYIRAQIEMEKIDRWSDRWELLSARVSELREHLPADVEAGFPPWADLPPYDPTRGYRPVQGQESFAWHRCGFRETAWASPVDFAARAHELFAAFPVRCVVFDQARESGLLFRNCPSLAQIRDLRLNLDVRDFELMDLVECPYLAGLEVLALSFSEPAPYPIDVRTVPLLGDEEAARLATCPHLTNVVSFYAQYNRIGPAGLAALVRSPHWQPAKRLGLNGNPVGDAGVRQLAQSSWLQSLVFLDLTWAEIGDDGLCEMAKAKPDRLQTLKIGGDWNRFTADGLRDLGECQTMHTLRELDCGWTPLDRAAVGALAASPSLAGLRSLDLCKTGLADEFVSELTQCRYLRRLRSLNLQHNPIGARGAIALAGSEILSSVEWLSLYETRIGDEGWIALASSEHLGNLRSLSTSRTGAGLAAVRAIAASCRLPNLRFLSFEGDPIGDAGARALCESPSLCGLSSITVSDCGISDDLLAALRERFGEALQA